MSRPEMMFDCCTMIKIDYLRPPIFIYASKSGIEMS